MRKSADTDVQVTTSSTRRKRSAWSVVLLVGLLVVLIAAGVIGYVAFTYMNGQKSYDELTEYAQLEANDNQFTLADMKVDWDGLRKINPDIVGWIYVPGTIINYPIVWKKDDDNYYMHHNFAQSSVGDFGAEYGCPVLSSANKPDWSDQLSVVAGHHLNNGTMFSFLESLRDTPVFNKNRTFYLLTPEQNYKLKTFSVNKVHGTSKDTVIPNFSSSAEFQEYLQSHIDESLAKAKPPLETLDGIDQVVAFYTCQEPDNRYRIVVYTVVEERVPADGSKKAESAVDGKDVAKVDTATEKRTDK